MVRTALTPAEKYVIEDKGTEAPYSGELLHEKRVGTFVCRRCGDSLFVSSSKFDSGCGRPSFDDTLPGKVTKQPDPDGMRTEIVCTSCGAHLGHVFEGEGFTDKGTRHCVNSLAMKFIPDKDTGKNS